MPTYWCLILWMHSWANVNLLNKPQPQKRDRTIFSPNVLLWARQKAEFFNKWLSLYFRWWNLPFIFWSAYFPGPCEEVIKGCEQVYSLSASHPCSPKANSSKAAAGMNKDAGEGCLESTREFSVTTKWFIISVTKNYHGTVQAKMKLFNTLTINLEKVPSFLVNKMHWALALNRLRGQERVSIQNYTSRVSAVHSSTRHCSMFIHSKWEEYSWPSYRKGASCLPSL